MSRRRRMGAITAGDPRINNLIQTSSPKIHGHLHHHGIVVEEIEGLIRVYKDGYVERLPVVAEVPCTWSPEPDVTSRDMVIDQATRVWARFYLPMRQGSKQLSLLVYFHGGGFCVGSAAWGVYHEFLARLASRAGCIIMSVNYRLAPENRLPAAYEDGLTAVKWVRQQQASRAATESSSRWWSHYCDFSRVFLGGDSAGGSIAYNVATRLGSVLSVGSSSEVVSIRGVILIQPFFGGEARTSSEKKMVQQPGMSALSLAASDSYWRLALPAGASRDHHWCNPRRSKLEAGVRVLVCVSEMDILRDRELEFCKAMKIICCTGGGKVDVEHVVHMGVGHAFQVLGNSRTCQTRTQEMMAQIKAFLHNS